MSPLNKLSVENLKETRNSCYERKMHKTQRKNQHSKFKIGSSSAISSKSSLGTLF